MLEEYKKVVNSGDGDAVKGDEAGRQATGKEGKKWIGGQQRGGAGQPPLPPGHDLTAAGVNMMNSLPVTSTGGYDKADSAGCDVRSDRKTLWR
ncbi:hypothetical protein BMT91_26560 [Escherichia coli]|uniref:Uncharacterized protein n=1 Tax=Escherichia coli TaxID=562 RepID=A0AAX0K763_ECOLX|nr:hypothetical protein BMT91_26560 [Escherichia coli]